MLFNYVESSSAHSPVGTTASTVITNNNNITNTTKPSKNMNELVTLEDVSEQLWRALRVLTVPHGVLVRELVHWALQYRSVKATVILSRICFRFVRRSE
jgi:hypothetical protein